MVAITAAEAGTVATANLISWSHGDPAVAFFV